MGQKQTTWQDIRLLVQDSGFIFSPRKAPVLDFDRSVSESIPINVLLVELIMRQELLQSPQTDVRLDVNNEENLCFSKI